MRNNIRIGHKTIGDGHPIFIVFEAGATHTGLESAMRLATAAKEAGADAIKFQMVDAYRLMADKSVQIDYGFIGGERSDSLHTILKQRELQPVEWHELARHCRTLHLPFFCTALFNDDVEFLKKLGCASIKISSGDINHFPLIEKVALSRRIGQLDTGNASLGEVEAAVDVFTSPDIDHGGLIIHHCPSGYPANPNNVNLRMITTLRQMFPYPIGFSDHSPGYEMDIAAVALGANLIEKTITEDKTIEGPEHMFSLQGDELSEFVDAILKMETAMGRPRKRLTKRDKEQRRAIRRGVYPDPEGEGGLEFRRPQHTDLTPADCYNHGLQCYDDIYEWRNRQ
jgi:sialic acid synthase SpsE